jgi:hypoxanthine-guanine phosphoribosyltransferase
MQAEYWPSRITEHAERDCANRQVLLVADILVGGDEHIKSSGLGRF